MNRAISVARGSLWRPRVRPFRYVGANLRRPDRPAAPRRARGMGIPGGPPPEQVGNVQTKAGPHHDALKQHVADGKFPATVVRVAPQGKLIDADSTVSGIRMRQAAGADYLFRHLFIGQAAVSVAAMMGGDRDIKVTDPVEVLSGFQGPAR